VTETELMPSLVVGDTELRGGKLKKGKGFSKPNTEPGQNIVKNRSLGPPVRCRVSLLHMQLAAGLSRDLLLPAANCL